MSLARRIERRLRGELLPDLPFTSHHYLTTRVFSLDDEPHQPSARLVDIVVDAVRSIRDISIDTVGTRPGVKRAIEPQRLVQWPGEHYKLLAALVRVVEPRRIIEIGTFEGWSSLCMKQYLRPDGKITTFDISPWNSFPNTCLEESDFSDERLSQIVEDLADPSVVSRHAELLAEADMIFMDGPHDGPTEYRMVDNLRTIVFTNAPLIVFDDIKMHSMLKFWRDLAMPKMDITSFGHWSGTGIAEWPSSTQ